MEFRYGYVKHLNKYILYLCPIAMKESLMDVVSMEMFKVVYCGKKFDLIHQCSMEVGTFARRCNVHVDEVEQLIRKHNQNIHFCHFDRKCDVKKVSDILNSWLVYNKLLKSL